MATLVRLLGTTAMVIGGTRHPLVNPSDRLPDLDGRPTYGFSEDGLAGPDGLATGYVGDALNNYIGPAGPSGEQYNVMAVWTPEEFWPVFGPRTFNSSVRIGLGNLNVCLRGSSACIAHIYPDGQGGLTDIYSVFAYSQSARIASLQKADLIKEYTPGDDDTIHHVTFVMIGNPNRPAGGILERFKGLYVPILDVTFDGASPTNSPVVDGEYLYPTADIVRQYDGWADFPAYPSLLAGLNAVLGIVYLHSDYFNGTAENPVAGQPYLDQGQVGDTNYYMLATKRLPLLLPLAAIGVPDPLLALFDAPLRLLVERAYDRDIPPGVPSPIRLFKLTNPITDIVNLTIAVVTGIDDAISTAFGDPNIRPFKTKPVESTFGVGGIVLPTVASPVAPVGPPPAVEARLAVALEDKPEAVAASAGELEPAIEAEATAQDEATQAVISTVADDNLAAAVAETTAAAAPPAGADAPPELVAEDATAAGAPAAPAAPSTGATEPKSAVAADAKDPAGPTEGSDAANPATDHKAPDNAAPRADADAAHSGGDDDKAQPGVKKEKKEKKGLHGARRHERKASAEATADSDASSLDTTGPRQRVKPAKDKKSVGGQPDAASASSDGATASAA